VRARAGLRGPRLRLRARAAAAPRLMGGDLVLRTTAIPTKPRAARNWIDLVQA